MDDERIALMALRMIRGVRDVTVRTLVQHCGSAVEALRTDAEVLAEAGGVGLATALRIVADRETARHHAEREMNFITKQNVRMYTPDDEGYPARLRDCPDAPLILCYRGTECLDATRIVSIVGTRHCTDYGLGQTERLVEELALLDPSIVVVSGLAYGIDGMAHRSALRMGLATVGVLAHGLDRIYPTAHRGMTIDMLRCGGLLTDYPTGTPPMRENFLSRNRIIAGLADATVVVESAARGGALSTAAHAYGYGRPVFAYPGRTTDEYSAGCLRMIVRGRARLITSADDLCRALGWTRAAPEVRATNLPRTPSAFPRPSVKVQPVPDNAVTRVLRTEGATQINDLAHLSNLSVKEVMTVLFDLEMDGFVTILPGGMYKLVR